MFYKDAPLSHFGFAKPSRENETSDELFFGTCLFIVDLMVAPLALIGSGWAYGIMVLCVAIGAILAWIAIFLYGNNNTHLASDLDVIFLALPLISYAATARLARYFSRWARR